MARILYASQSRVCGSVYAEMERIRASAVRHNEPAGVFTALLYQSGWFVQWKEGPPEALSATMARVSCDPRHHGLRVVHASKGPRLLMGPWSMAIVQATEPAGEMERRVSMLRAQLEAGVPCSPPAAWRQLSTPMAHPGATRQADPEAFQRVLVCAARGTASFDLVQRVALGHARPVVHRRFAGARQLDVGTDYVDVAEGDQLMRVIAMARKGLALPLTRAFVPDYSHVLLLLSGDGHSDEGLVDKVAQACAGLPRAPALLAVGLDAPLHARLFARARRRGLVYLPVQADASDPARAWAAVQPALAQWRDAANSSVNNVPPVAPRLQAA